MAFPIDLATYSAFLLTASAIVLTPGPDTLIILRYSLSSGRNVGLATVIGVQFGLIGHTILAIFGISVLIASGNRITSRRPRDQRSRTGPGDRVFIGLQV